MTPDHGDLHEGIHVPADTAEQPLVLVGGIQEDLLEDVSIGDPDVQVQETLAEDTTIGTSDVTASETLTEDVTLEVS